MIRPSAVRHTRRAARGALIALTALLVVGCPGSTEVDPQYFENYVLRVVQGDGETKPVGTAIPVTIHLTDPGSLQYPNVNQAYVTWTVSSGGGSVTIPGSQSITDLNGQASATWTLGPQAGEQTLTVRAYESSPNSLPGGGQSKTIIVRANALSNAVERITVTPDAAITVGTSVPVAYSLLNGRGEVLSGRNVNVFSSNASILRVDAVPGGVTATGLAAGTADVVVQSEGKEGRARITITLAPVATIALAPADTILTQGGTVQLRVTLRDAAGALLTGRTVTYESLDPTIARVSSTGLVTALLPGVAGIAARAEGREARVVLGVLAAPAAIATLSLAPNPMSLSVGGADTLRVTARDAAGNVLTGRPVIFTSSNTAVAVVGNDGVVVGLSAGEATITATSTADLGRTATARVIVTNPCPGGCTVTISTSGNRTSLQVGHTLLFQTIVRDAAGNQITTPGLPIQYATSNAAVARVVPAGPGGPPGYFADIVGVGTGQATITATVGGRSGSVTVTVTP
jgi:hypothetical protein